jgi:NAD(P)-dependent dehydrogenase (short-subunit alcohol dehydrogenase family)
MKRNKYGRIVNVSSGAGSLNYMAGGTPAYSVSKAALNAFSRILAAELNGTGILVNSVDPGWVSTDMGSHGGRPVEEEVHGIIWAATLPDDGPSGGFFFDGKPAPW